jgi:predicted ATPase
VSPGATLRVKAIPEADLAVANYRYELPADVPSRPFRATNVGFGVSYALPPIMALLAPKSDGSDVREHLVIIENPEAHIHPAGQTAMAELAARAVAGGSQVILETHSDHVLNGVRLAVAEGILDPDQVVIHYFERTGLDVRVTTPVLTDAGRLDVWPEGFFDQHERNLSRLISIPQAPAQEG